MTQHPTNPPKQPVTHLGNVQGLVQFSSPLPPPDILDKYEKLQPGLIQEIITLTKIQGDHRRNLENKNVDAQINQQINRDKEIKRGQQFAFVISIVGICGAVLTAYLGHETAASFLSVTALTGLAARFINGRKPEKNNP